MSRPATLLMAGALFLPLALGGCSEPSLHPLTLAKVGPDSFELTLDTGVPVVDAVVEQLGHEPNGPFWDGVAEWLIRTQFPALEGTIGFNSEAGTFLASGPVQADWRSWARVWPR
jgi:hypothetical protein